MDGNVIGNPALYWFDHFVYPDGTYSHDDILHRLHTGLSYDVGIHRQIAADVFSRLLLHDFARDKLIEHETLSELLELAIRDPMPPRPIGLGAYRQGERVLSRIDTVGINYGRNANYRSIVVPLGIDFAVEVHAVEVYPRGERDKAVSLESDWFYYHFDYGIVSVDRIKLRQRLEPGDYMIRLEYRIETGDRFHPDKTEPRVLAHITHVVSLTLYEEN